MKKLSLILACLGLLLIPAFAEAAYPEKPVQLVVAFPPGGGSDLSARVAVEFINRQLPQPIVVSNISGGTGSVGAKQAMRSKPDGYVLYWEHPTLAVQSATGAIDFSHRDFDIIGVAMRSTFVLVANKKLPIKTAPDLMKYMQENPGKVRWPMSFGAMSHYGFLYVADGWKNGKLEPGIVANAGDKGRITAIIGDHADASCVSLAAAAPYIASGDVLALGVLSKERISSMPNLPTLAEQGIDAVYDQIFTLFAPKGTPDAIKKQLSDAMQKGLATPEAKKAIENLYCEPYVLSPEESLKRWNAQEDFNRKLAEKYLKSEKK